MNKNKPSEINIILPDNKDNKTGYDSDGEEDLNRINYDQLQILAEVGFYHNEYISREILEKIKLT